MGDLLETLNDASVQVTKLASTMITNIIERINNFSMNLLNQIHIWRNNVSEMSQQQTRVKNALKDGLQQLIGVYEQFENTQLTLKIGRDLQRRVVPPPVEEVHYEGKYECDQCPFKTDDQKMMSRHMRLRHDATNLYRCPQCQFEAGTIKPMVGHIIRNHTNYISAKRWVYRCPFTGEQVINKHHLNSHIIQTSQFHTAGPVEPDPINVRIES